MALQLNIHYDTQPGQHLFISGTGTKLGNWNENKALKLNYIENGNWSVTIENNKNLKTLEYKYFLKDESGLVIWELGNKRLIDFSVYAIKNISINDTWHYPDSIEQTLQSSAFTKAIMNSKAEYKTRRSRAKKQLTFSIDTLRIGENLRVCIIGNQKELGNWDPDSPLLLSCKKGESNWSVTLNASSLSFPILYKYGFYDNETAEVIAIEEGENRIVNQPELSQLSEYIHLQADQHFRYPGGNWKGAGVAVPVFSLRSDDGFGIGEFSDLIEFIDWAKSVGMKMVQILPINETITTHNWLDSYPYKSISVTALHPIYLNLRKMGLLKDKKELKCFDKYQKELNKETHVNYPEVLAHKSRYYKLLFDQEKNTFFESSEYKAFFKANKDWLVPYAAFAYLRDQFKNADFTTWGEYSKYNTTKIERLCKPNTKNWDDIAVHYFIQFHLDKQLQEISSYARQQGIVLKGDIPIGISPKSVEAWTEPHYFNMNGQAGAPPDDFAVKGQNWGFPTYNWQRMAKDDYSWWRKRLQKMSEYFDAYRIDHILGFFRIWEIPLHAVEGILGYFYPALPMSADEIQSFGVGFDYERLTKPYITRDIVDNLFGIHSTKVQEQFLFDVGNNILHLKEEFGTQAKINSHFLNNREEEDLTDHERTIRNGLFDLAANVIFVQTGYDQWHPRISLHSTSSFNHLDDQTKQNLQRLYTHYFYERHNDFWYHKGLEKLPAIINSSNMLVCGEDLGMVPDCVPPVMNQLNILNLEIQRMSKDPTVKFAHPADAPYLSVCTTSTHDMSTIRGWWEENKEMIQQFYNYELGNHGGAPYFAEPWLCEQIIVQHLYSPAMWVTIPIQDYIAIDGDLRWHETHTEQINEPSDVRHKWRYRMNQSINELKEAKSFNEKIKELISKSGRNTRF